MQTLTPGAPVPPIELVLQDGGPYTLGRRAPRWELLVVYRGRHCPRCKTYLAALGEKLHELDELHTDVIVASADPLEKAQADRDEFGWRFPLAYGLSIEQTRTLDLYVSEPASAQETDRPFAEPGLVLVNPDGAVQVVARSNSASFRPDLDVVLDGIRGIQKRGLPVRGLG